MRAADFTVNSPGKLVRIPEGTVAYVPDPLPPKALSLDMEVFNLLPEASYALGQLDAFGQRLPNPHLLIGPFLRQEAVLSSRIEGTIATMQQLLLFEAAPKGTPETPDVLEVANYVASLELGLAQLAKLPVCLRLINNLHCRLMADVRGGEHRPGDFRTGQNFIGRLGQRDITKARFVPPPVPEMQHTLDDFEHYLHKPSELPPLVRLALLHYQFETIHPFMDGNGRIGRLLIVILLSEWKLLQKPLLYLSAYFERYRKEYEGLLFQVSRTGEWLEWVKFFLRGIKEQSQDSVARCNTLLGLWETYRQKFQFARSSALLLELIDVLFEYPAITISRAAKRLQITPHAAQHNVNKLISAGILREATGKRRNRVYVAHEIIKALEA